MPSILSYVSHGLQLYSDYLDLSRIVYLEASQVKKKRKQNAIQFLFAI